MSKRQKVQLAVSALKRLYPLELADSSWDNTGLLVDSSGVNSSTTPLSILLTVDLTTKVAQEAIKNKTDLIVAYHPFIFRPLKSITPSGGSQQDSLIQLIANGISVYSPHTAVDAVQGGVNDWLCEALESNPSRSVIEPSKVTEGAGMGRVVTLSQPTDIVDLVKRIKEHLELPYIQLATPPVFNSDLPPKVETVAICAGSGSSVFSGVKADLYFTGEMSHHETLALVESGSYVITCNHSNTERGYLKEMKGKLEEELLKQGLEYNVGISREDRDPLVVV
ncbi:BA75_04095T0 [Komagataella pastoris]|uniref:BA75_04095T0 n=1 Tax=Komagataella pastoris TaxID=4922 RepID=A0A1B2JFJ6_PICPA|nr:BA75_04095T0 [Komagataella pastoris]